MSTLRFAFPVVALLLAVLATPVVAQKPQDDFCHSPAPGKYITKRISNVGPNGEDGVLGSLPKGASHPAASNIGEWIVWDSGFTNHPEGFNGKYQVRVSTTLPELVPPSVLISRNPLTGEPGDGHSDFADISGTGRFIVFPSKAKNLGPEGGGQREVYVADRDPFKNGFDGPDFVIRRVSQSAAGVPSGGDCRAVSISNNGRYVTFSVDAKEPGFHPLANGLEQVYRKDNQTGDLVMVSQVNGVAGDGISTRADISVGGQFVSFVSNSKNFPLGDGSLAGNAGLFQAYLYDFTSNTIELVSTPDGGATAGNGNTLNAPSVSQTGDVVFASYADNLAPFGDFNGISDVFFKPRSSPKLRRISVNPWGGEVKNGLRFSYPSFAGSGTLAVFTYHNPGDNDLTGGDNAGQTQLFAHNLVTRETKMVSTRDRCGLHGSSNPNIPHFQFDFSGGNTEVPFIGLNAPVPFMTMGSNLDPRLPNGDQNDARDVYVHLVEL